MKLTKDLPAKKKRMDDTAVRRPGLAKVYTTMRENVMGDLNGEEGVSRVLEQWTEDITNEGVRPIDRMLGVLSESMDHVEVLRLVINSYTREALANYKDWSRECDEQEAEHQKACDEYENDLAAIHGLEDRVKAYYLHHGSVRVVMNASTLPREAMTFIIEWLGNNMEGLEERMRCENRVVIDVTAGEEGGVDSPMPNPKPTPAPPNQFVCQICLDDPIDTLLKCRHVICGKCVVKIVDEQEDPTCFSCPWCRQTSQFDEIRKMRLP